jgi:hypothetical protein
VSSGSGAPVPEPGPGGADELALAPTIERGEVGARPARVVGGLQLLVPAELRGRLEARAARMAAATGLRVSLSHVALQALSHGLSDLDRIRKPGLAKPAARAR